MANFLPSALLAGQAMFTEKFSRGEWKMPDVAAWQVSEKAGIANPSLNELRTREDRSVNAYVPIRQAATNGTARNFGHTGLRGDSIAQAITWSTFSEPFSISLKQADNNVETFGQMFAASLKNAIYNINDRVDAAFIASLIADRTQVNVGGGKGTFDGVSFYYDVPASETDYYLQNIKNSMAQNLYKGELIAIHDSYASTNVQRRLEQGSGNSTNLSWQDNGVLNIPTTRTIQGSLGSSLVFENGLVATIPWIPKQNRKSLDPVLASSYVGDYGSIAIPEMGVSYAIHAYGQRADTSASNGSAQDDLMEYEVSIDTGYVSSPLSAFRGANDSSVYGFEQE